MKKSSINLIFFIIVISFLLIGCGTNNDTTPNNSDVTVNELNKSDEQVVNPNIANEDINELDKEAIQNKLNAQSDKVYAITWSNDSKFVAYVSGDPLSMYGQLNIWEVGTEEPVIIENLEDRICELILSPNNEYLLADIGTSTQRFGAIVSNIDKTKIAEVGYFGKAFWSNDSNYLIIGTISDIQPNIEIELSGTVDIASYNIKTGELKIIDKGTADYYFSPSEVKKDGTVVYTKRYFVGQTEEETFEYKFN